MTSQVAGEAALVPITQKGNVFTTDYGILYDIQTRFNGWKNLNFSNSKTMEQIFEGGIKQGVRIEPNEYTPSNLPPWCYTPGWDAKKREKYLLRKNVELKKIREKHETTKREKKFRMMKVDEFIVAKCNEFIKDEAAHLSNNIFEYVKDVRIKLTDGKTVAECTYWWVNGAIQGKDILETFENYLERKLSTDFAECREKSICMMAMNVSNKLKKREKRILAESEGIILCNFCFEHHS